MALSAWYGDAFENEQKWEEGARLVAPPLLFLRILRGLELATALSVGEPALAEGSR